MAEVATKDDVRTLMGAWDEFKTTNEAQLAAKVKGVVDPLLDEKLGRINESLDKFEGQNAQVTAAAGEARQAKQAADELKTQLDAIMVKLNRPGETGQGVGARSKAELKARANDWLRGVVDAHQRGVANLTEAHRKAIEEVAAEFKVLSIGDDTTGGYLAPVDMSADIIKGVTLISPMRSLVRIRTTSKKSQQVPVRTGQFAAVRSAELSQRSETQGLAYGMVEIPAPEATAIIDISNENLEDSAYDLAAEVQSEAELQFAKQEGAEVISGTGVGQCEGVLVNASVANTHSGDANLITGDGLLQLSYDLKSDYAKSGTWVMNRKTLGKIRTLKNGVGDYLWMPGLAAGKPNTIDGAPYAEMPDMPDIAAGAYPVAFGDWMRAYSLLDRIVMTMLRDPYTQAAGGMVRFWFRRRFGGGVTLAEAVRKLLIAA